MLVFPPVCRPLKISKSPSDSLEHMTRAHWLTDEVKSYRPSCFWEVLDECGTDRPIDMPGSMFGTVFGARALYLQCGAFWRWVWLCPKCKDLRGVLYVTNLTQPVCRQCGNLHYPSSYEKPKRGLFGFTRAIHHWEDRGRARRARWRRYYQRHKARILARRHELRAARAQPR